MRFSKYHLAVLALIGTNIIWGASIPIFRWSLESIPPFTFAFLRFFLASLILLPLTLHRLKITKHDAVSLFVLAVIGFFFHIGLLLFGLTTSSSVNSSVIATAAPIFLITSSIFFYKENVRTRIILGTVISLLGVAIIILRPIIDRGSGRNNPRQSAFSSVNTDLCGLYPATKKLCDPPAISDRNVLSFRIRNSYFLSFFPDGIVTTPYPQSFK